MIWPLMSLVRMQLSVTAVTWLSTLTTQLVAVLNMWLQHTYINSGNWEYHHTNLVTLSLLREWPWRCSVQFSRSVMSNSLWRYGLQHARLPCPSSTPGVCSNSCPSNWWCHEAISSSVVPFFSCLSLSQHQGLFQWVSSSHHVAKVLEFQLQHQSFQWIFRIDFL